MDASYQHCEQRVRAGDKDRYLATLFAPADKRGPLFALYAFDLEIASVRDRVREPMAGEIRLQWWRDVLTGERAGEAAANPVAAALVATITRFALPADPLLDLIEAHSFDLYDDPMPTLAALEAYGRKTASVVFTQAASICGASAGGGGRACRCGMEHHRIAARLCAPRLAPAGVCAAGFGRRRPQDVLAGRSTPDLEKALGALRGEARRHLTVFEAQLPTMPPASIPAFLTIALMPGYLSAMERPGYDPFRTAVEVAQWRRQWALWRAARRYSRLMRG